VAAGEASEPVRLGRLAWALWGAGFLTAAARIGIGLRRAGRILRSARRAKVSGAAVWISPEAAAPGVYGLLEVVGTAIGQFALGERSDPLIRVEFRCVRREVLDVQTRLLHAELA